MRPADGLELAWTADGKRRLFDRRSCVRRVGHVEHCFKHVIGEAGVHQSLGALTAEDHLVAVGWDIPQLEKLLQERLRRPCRGRASGLCFLRVAGVVSLWRLGQRRVVGDGGKLNKFGSHALRCVNLADILGPEPLVNVVALPHREKGDRIAPRRKDNAVRVGPVAIEIAVRMPEDPLGLAREGIFREALECASDLLLLVARQLDEVGDEGRLGGQFVGQSALEIIGGRGSSSVLLELAGSWSLPIAPCLYLPIAIRNSSSRASPGACLRTPFSRFRIPCFVNATSCIWPRSNTSKAAVCIQYASTPYPQMASACVRRRNELSCARGADSVAHDPKWITLPRHPPSSCCASSSKVSMVLARRPSPTYSSPLAP